MTEVDMAMAASWQDADVEPPEYAERLQRRRAFSAARRHSRRIAFLRVLLPVAGLVAVTGFVVKTHFSLPGDIDLTAANLSVTRNSIIMDRPHLTGFGDGERGYSLSADRAIQPLTSPGQVRLEEISARITSAAQGETSITAEAGDYNHEKGTLQLLGAIAVDSAEGYRLRMSGANVDFGEGRLVSDKPVSIGFGDSEITGERMTVSDDGKVLVIEGKVRTLLMPPKRAAAPTVSAPPTAQATE